MVSEIFLQFDSGRPIFEARFPGLNGEAEMGRGAIGTGRGWQWRGGQGEEEMERGTIGKGGGRRWEGANGEGGKGKEVGMGRGRRRSKRSGDFTDGYDGMRGWT